MDPVTQTVPAERAGQRLDAVLHALAPELSRGAARTLCEIGAVALDEVRCDGPQQRVRAGAAILWWPQTAELARALRLPVLFADDDVLVLDKPPGLAVHGGPLVDDSVAARLQAHFAGAGPGLAHRLDRSASGLLLVGRHPPALAALARAMEHGAIERHYLAIVAGVPQQDRFTIDLPLKVLDEPRGDRPKVVVDREAGQPARSDVTVLDRRQDCALVGVALHTGRTHQVRVHLQATGHPLLGDPRYGDAASNERARATYGVQRVLLHGTRLSFPHPARGRRFDLQSPHPPDFARVFHSLRRVPPASPDGDRNAMMGGPHPGPRP